MKVMAMFVVLVIAAASGEVSAQGAKVQQATGKVTMLRVHDQGTKYGPANDSIDAEVVIWLSTQKGKAFGFQLRADEPNPARRAMYDLLLQAYIHTWSLRIDYFETAATRKNHIMFRAWTTRETKGVPVSYP